MKRTYLFALLFSILFINISCDSDDDQNTEEPLTVEQGKTDLEDNFIELLNIVESFKSDEDLNEIVDLAEFLNASETSRIASNSKNNIFSEIALKTITNVANIEASSNGIIQFNAKQSLVLAEKETLLSDFDEAKGVYEWNATTEEFDRIGDSEDIIYNIAYNGKDAVFSFTDFDTTTTSGNDIEGEIPTLVKANLKIDNSEVFSQEFTSTFNEDQLIPSKFNNTTQLGELKFETSFSNDNNQKVVESLEIKIGSDVIFGLDSTINGSFSNNNLDEGDNVEDVIDDATLSFQFLNAKLSISAEDTGFNSNDDLSIDEQVELLNNNTEGKITVYGNFVASVEFYKDQDTYTDYIYNSNTGTYEETEVSEDVLNVRFLFADGTTSDFDTYIDGSFTRVEDKFETVFEAFEELFGNL